jgi:large conductance mechanosensitive channel
MLKGFKEFIMRGNVIDLAVAVVLGAAFGAVINQLTKSFLEPLIKAIFGGGQFGGSFRFRGQTFDYGAFVNAVITFLLTAAALYFFVVLPINKLNQRRARGPAAQPEEMSDELRVLIEIRDELRRRPSS